MNDSSEKIPHSDKSGKSRSVDTLLSFPTRFPIKIMGKNNTDFRDKVATITNQYIAQKDLINVNEQPSGNGKYLSITVTAIFHNKASIDAVYVALTEEPSVIMAL